MPDGDFEAYITRQSICSLIVVGSKCSLGAKPSCNNPSRCNVFRGQMQVGESSLHIRCNSLSASARKTLSSPIGRVWHNTTAVSRQRPSDSNREKEIRCSSLNTTHVAKYSWNLRCENVNVAGSCALPRTEGLASLIYSIASSLCGSPTMSKPCSCILPIILSRVGLRPILDSANIQNATCSAVTLSSGLWSPNLYDMRYESLSRRVVTPSLCMGFDLTEVC